MDLNNLKVNKITKLDPSPKEVFALTLTLADAANHKKLKNIYVN